MSGFDYNVNDTTKEDIELGNRQNPAGENTSFVPKPEETQIDHTAVACWYIMSILATIFCFIPCGLIGLVHVMFSKQEAKLGDYKAHGTRLYQAKVWTSWSIALGVAVILFVIIYICVIRRRIEMQSETLAASTATVQYYIGD